MDDDDDIHMCGRCKLTFADVHLFIEHKKACKQQNILSLNVNVNSSGSGGGVGTPGKSTTRGNSNVLAAPDDVGLGEVSLDTDEAAVISLLANQLSSNNQTSSQPPKHDDLDQFWFVRDEDFEQVAVSNSVSPPSTSLVASASSTPTKHQSSSSNSKRKASSSSERVSTTIVRTGKNQTKTTIKIMTSGRNVTPCTEPGCSFSCVYLKDLRRHMLTHTGDRT